MNTDNLILTRTVGDDLDAFFSSQLDDEANHLAAFTAKDAKDKTAYLEKYSKFLTDPTINMRTIKIGNEIAGSISKFLREGDAEITYWIDKKFWGRGVATRAMREFLSIEKIRPILGRVAFDNFGSQKVLERSGFVRIGTDRGFANARQAEIEEFIYKLSG